MGPQFHEDEVLEGCAVVCRAWHEHPAAGDFVHDSHIEKPESRRLNDAALRPLRPCRYPRGDERVHEDVEIAANGVRGDADLAGDRGGVDDLTVGEGSGLEEPLKRGQVAGERLSEHLLAEIVADVCREPR